MDNEEWEKRWRIAYRAARKYGLCHDDAEDVAQEACLRVMKYAQMEGHGGAYMNKVAYTVMTEMRKEGRRFATNVDALGVGDPDEHMDGYSMQIMESTPYETLPTGEMEERESVRRICEAGGIPEAWADKIEDWAMDPGTPDGEVNREIRALRRKLRPTNTYGETEGVHIKKVGEYFHVVGTIKGRRIHFLKTKDRKVAEGKKSEVEGRFGI